MKQSHKKLQRKRKRKVAKPYECRYRERYGLSLAEMRNLVPWSYGSVWNALNKKGYRKEKAWLLLKVEAYLEKRKRGVK